MKILVTLIFAFSTSLYAEGVDYYSLISPSAKPVGFYGTVTLGPCSGGIRLPEASKARPLQKIGEIYSCDPDHQKGNFLTNKSCTIASACKMNTLDTKETNQAVDDVLKGFLAKEHLKQELGKHADKMEKFEILRAFSQEIYERPYGKECSVRFDPSMPQAGKCNLSLMDEAFKEQQEKCGVMDRACFLRKETDGPMNYSSFAEKTKNPKASLMIDYFAYRIEDTAKLKVKSNNEFLEKLGDFVTSDEFKKASSDKKSELFVSFVDKNSKIADPLLSFDLSNINLPAKERLANSKKLVGLFGKSKISKKSFLKDFESYREDRTKEIFDKKSLSCKEVASIKNFCADMTKIANGGKVNVRGDKSKVTFLSLTKTLVEKIKDPTLLERIKGRSGNKVTDENIEIIINAKKCEVFGMSNNEEDEGSISPYALTNESFSTKALGRTGIRELDSEITPDYSEYIAPLDNSSPFSSYAKSTWSSSGIESSLPNGLNEDSGREKSGISIPHDSISATPSSAVDDHSPVSVAPTHETQPSNISNNIKYT
ncbi:MAG: hypothetical protein K2Q18_08175 [Bdellovibrionales bacterium]|nr:hypothetical protein [Bdellovibrionales bacterium]